MSELESLRERMKTFVEHEEGKTIKERIHSIVKETYKPKHTKEAYYDFIKEIKLGTERTSSQDGSPYYRMFSVLSQHVSGDSFEEVLDNAIDKVKYEEKFTANPNLCRTCELEYPDEDLSIDYGKISCLGCRRYIKGRKILRKVNRDIWKKVFKMLEEKDE